MRKSDHEIKLPTVGRVGGGRVSSDLIATLRGGIFHVPCVCIVSLGYMKCSRARDR